MNIGHGPCADASRCRRLLLPGPPAVRLRGRGDHTEVGVDDDDGLETSGAFIWPLIVMVCVAAAAVVAAVA